MSRSFPYADRASAARSAMAAVAPAFAKVRRRNDREDPDTKAWIRTIAQAYAAVDAAYAPEFHDAIIALRRRDFGAIDPLIEFLEADPIIFFPFRLCQGRAARSPQERTLRHEAGRTDA